MVTVLLWIVAVVVPCALVLRLSEIDARPKRATIPDRSPRQRPSEPARSRRRPAAAAPPTQLMVHDAGHGLLRRLRSSMALVALVAVVGLMVAVSLGGLLTALAVALRAAVE